MEVDQYLSDPNEGTGILEFWQVWFYFLFYQLTWFLIDNIVGKSKTISTYFLPGNGYFANPGIKCSIRKSVLKWKRNNDCTLKTYLSSSNGITTNTEVFYQQRQISRVYGRIELEWWDERVWKSSMKGTIWWCRSIWTHYWHSWRRLRWIRRHTGWFGKCDCRHWR